MIDYDYPDLVMYFNFILELILDSIFEFHYDIQYFLIPLIHMISSSYHYLILIDVFIILINHIPTSINDIIIKFNLYSLYLLLHSILIQMQYSPIIILLIFSLAFIIIVFLFIIQDDWFYLLDKNYYHLVFSFQF